MFAALADPENREITEEISSMVEEFHLLALVVYAVNSFFIKILEKCSWFSNEFWQCYETLYRKYEKSWYLLRNASTLQS